MASRDYFLGGIAAGILLILGFNLLINYNPEFGRIIMMLSITTSIGFLIFKATRNRKELQKLAHSESFCAVSGLMLSSNVITFVVVGQPIVLIILQYITTR